MKKILKFCLCIILMLASIIFIYYHYKNVEVTDIDNNILENEDSDVVTPLIEEYNNNDIKAKLIIPGVVETPVVQSIDNEYYKSHDLYKDINEQGAIYLDYRNDLNDKKILIYGDNKNPKISLFNNLLKYEDEDFYKKHPKIYLYTKDQIKTYNIFSIYNEKSDLSFTNLKSFNGYSYYEHLKEFQNNSIYLNDVQLTANSKILVLEANVDQFDNITGYFLIIGVLE